MIAKITRGNQITIPKEIVRSANLNESAPYVDVTYSSGVIFLKPVVIEERIQPEQFEKFQNWAIAAEKGDATYDSISKAASQIKKRTKKS